jgi:hypothetical protein
MLGDCLTRCHLEMWWLGMLSDGDMWNVGKGKTHWNYFDKCNRKACRKILCYLFSKCDSHVIAHMKFFCIQSCLYVITLLASARVLPVKPLCQHLTDDQIWDLRCRPIWWSSKLVIMPLFLPRLNVYEQTFVLVLDVDVFLSSLSSGEILVCVCVLDVSEICVVLRLLFCLWQSWFLCCCCITRTIYEFLTKNFRDQFQKLDHFLSFGFWGLQVGFLAVRYDK